MKNATGMALCWIVVGFFLLSTLFPGCDNQNTKIYTVGVLNDVPVLDTALAGLKAGMTELGYIEGKTIRYIYDGPIRDMDKLPAAAEALTAKKVDLIFSITTPATQAAKQAVTGTKTPVVFTVVTDPVGSGIVETLEHPGGNITGIAFGIQESRRLEWLLQIAPGIKQIYVPYNPNDKSPVSALKTIRTAAEKLNVKLITRKVTDPETLNDAISNIPDQADAVFILPDSLMAEHLSDLARWASKRNLPTSGSNITTVETNHVLTAFGCDLYLSGKQAARLANLIFHGAQPAGIPVETAEFYLAINLKVARTIGLDIPDDILRQADRIIR